MSHLIFILYNTKSPLTRFPPNSLPFFHSFFMLFNSLSFYLLLSFLMRSEICIQVTAFLLVNHIVLSGIIVASMWLYPYSAIFKMLVSMCRCEREESVCMTWCVLVSTAILSLWLIKIVFSQIWRAELLLGYLGHFNQWLNGLKHNVHATWLSFIKCFIT